MDIIYLIPEMFAKMATIVVNVMNRLILLQTAFLIFTSLITMHSFAANSFTTNAKHAEEARQYWTQERINSARVKYGLTNQGLVLKKSFGEPSRINSDQATGLVEYISPTPGSTVPAPINFSWKLSGYSDIDLILLIVTDPNGEQSYMTRLPTPDGIDSVSIPLDSNEGEYRWEIWVKKNRNNDYDQHSSITFFVLPPPVGACEEKSTRFPDRASPVSKAIGRIVFTLGDQNYICTGTLVEGANDRAIISTAGHCVFDHDLGYPKNVLFIPGQDDDQNDQTDLVCDNDPYGCFVPTIGVVSSRFLEHKNFRRHRYDYGFYVVPDTNLGPYNQPTIPGYKGRISIEPMSISFKGMAYNNPYSYILGYPQANRQNSHLMYSQGIISQAPTFNGENTGENYMDCGRLSPGASGGPWTQSNPFSGKIDVASVTSGRPLSGAGKQSPPFNHGGAQCVYSLANSVNLNLEGLHIATDEDTCDLQSQPDPIQPPDKKGNPPNIVKLKWRAKKSKLKVKVLDVDDDIKNVTLKLSGGRYNQTLLSYDTFRKNKAIYIFKDLILEAAINYQFTILATDDQGNETRKVGYVQF